jgi:hypothetical protein
LSTDVHHDQRATKASNCSFCGRALGKEYFFVCHICGAKYCYIHMYRHGKAHRPQAGGTPKVTERMDAKSPSAFVGRTA